MDKVYDGACGDDSDQFSSSNFEYISDESENLVRPALFGLHLRHHAGGIVGPHLVAPAASGPRTHPLRAADGFQRLGLEPAAEVGAYGTGHHV